jgi:DNA polymerase-1
MAYRDKEPALQNTPLRTEAARKIRDAFLPRDGQVFIDPDYAAIELRIFSMMEKNRDR